MSYASKIVPIRILNGFNEASPLDITTELNTYASFMLHRKYTEYGVFELQINALDSKAKYLTKGKILYIGIDKCGIITYRNLKEGNDSKGGVLTVKGFTLEYLNKSRIVIPPIGQASLTIKDKASSIVYKLIKSQIAEESTSDRRIDFLVQEKPPEGGEVLEHSSRFKQLDEEIHEVLEKSTLGIIYKLDIPHRRIVYSTYEGKDRTTEQSVLSPVIFSRDFANLSTADITDDTTEMRNFAYVAGQGEGAERVVIEVDKNSSKSTGYNRKELYVDARDLENTESLPKRGKDKLNELQDIYTVETQINPNNTFKFEKDYFLGDKVTVSVKDVESKVIIHTRITAVKETWNRSGYTVDLTFDKKIPNLLDKIDEKINSKTVQRDLPKDLGKGTNPDLLAQNKVLHTLEDVNNPNLLSGVYSAEGIVGGDTRLGAYFALFVNQHRLTAGYGTQIAVPYTNGHNSGVFYRNCSGGAWSPYDELAPADRVVFMGRVTSLKPHTGVILEKKDAITEPDNDMYYKGLMELRVPIGRIPSIGFHTVGASACALYESGGELYTRSSGGLVGKLITNHKSHIVITPTEGLSVTDNRTYRVGDAIYVAVTVKKVSGFFAPHTPVHIGYLPVNALNDFPLSVTTSKEGARYDASGSICFMSGNTIILNASHSTLDRITIGGVILV